MPATPQLTNPTTALGFTQVLDCYQVAVSTSTVALTNVAGGQWAVLYNTGATAVLIGPSAKEFIGLAASGGQIIVPIRGANLAQLFVKTAASTSTLSVLVLG